MKIDEENFINYIKKKDERALDYVVDSYGGLIKAIVDKELYNLEHLKDECINDILLAVWQHIDSFDNEKGSFKNWIGAVSKYKCINYKRKYLKLVNEENIDDLELQGTNFVEEEIIKNDLNEEVEELLNALKPQDRELFIKHYIEEKDINYISKTTGIKKSVIYNRLSRGRYKLKTLFTKCE